MTAVAESLQADARTALEVLERVLEEPATAMTGDLPEAVRALVRLRNRLIQMADASDAPQHQRDLQNRTNAVLSVVTGGEYPMVGVRRERIVEARDALRKLCAEL